VSAPTHRTSFPLRQLIKSTQIDFVEKHFQCINLGLLSSPSTPSEAFSMNKLKACIHPK
jgi:hypothetical protein